MWSYILQYYGCEFWTVREIFDIKGFERDRNKTFLSMPSMSVIYMHGIDIVMYLSFYSKCSLLSLLLGYRQSFNSENPRVV